jgi:four helix bundle protein
LKIARGSLMELQTRLLLAKALVFIQIPQSLNELQMETDRVLRDDLQPGEIAR